LIRNALRRGFPWLAAAWLAFLSPFLLFITIEGWGWLLGLPALWGASRLIRGYAFARTPLNRPLFVIGGMTLLSLAITPDMSLSLPKAAGLFLGLGVFFVVVDVCESRRGMSVSLAGFVLVGAAIGVLGLLGTRWLEKSGLLSAVTDRLPQVISGLPGAAQGFHPNEVAGALLWVIPPALAIGVGLWRDSALRRWGVLAGIAGVWMAGVLLITQSRSGWFGLAAALLVMIALAFQRARRWLIVPGIALLALIALVGRGGSGEDPATLSIVESSVGAVTWDFRLEVWRVALHGVADFPFTGMGIGVFREVARYLYAPAVSPSFDIAHAHNELLQAALDLGVLGLLAFVALHGVAFRLLRAVWRATDRADASRVMALGLGGGLFAHFVYGLTDTVALGAKPGVLFWMLLGLIVGLHGQTRSRLSGQGL